MVGSHHLGDLGRKGLSVADAAASKKARVQFGPKKDKVGYLDKDRRIWVRDAAHAGLPEHWDVQVDGGRDYLKVDEQGNRL